MTCNCDIHKSMRKSVDSKVAPQGYYAVATDLAGSCKGCVFDSADSHKICSKKKCLSMERVDRRNVIFKETI